MRWTKIYIQFAGGFLLAAALERFLVAAQTDTVLSLSEPMLDIPIHDAVMIVGILELGVALVCLLGKRTGVQIGWLLWLMTNYFVYWTCLLVCHRYSQMTAIGSLTDPLRLAHGPAGLAVTFIPAFLFLGACLVLALPWMQSKVRLQKERNAGSLKMSCPACGLRIQFPIGRLGQKLPCPQCKNAIKLRKPENLKMSCFFCHEHIEFPSHAIGEKMPCPHCKMDITLKEPE